MNRRWVLACLSLLLGYHLNGTHPTGGPEEQFRFQINFMFPVPRG